MILTRTLQRGQTSFPLSPCPPGSIQTSPPSPATCREPLSGSSHSHHKVEVVELVEHCQLWLVWLVEAVELVELVELVGCCRPLLVELVELVELQVDSVVFFLCSEVSWLEPHPFPHTPWETLGTALEEIPNSTFYM